MLAGRGYTTSASTISVLDPATLFYVWDDFASGFSTGPSSTLGWTINAGAMAVAASEAGRPGIYQRSTSATQNTNAALHVRTTATVGTMSPADTFDLLWIVRPTQAGSNFQVRVGLANSAIGDPPNDGIYFERAVTDTNWYCLSRIGSASGKVDTGTELAAATWYRLRIWRVDGSTVACSVNGGASITTASVTNVMLQPWIQIKNPAAAAATTMDIDYFDLAVGGLVR